MKYAFIQRHRRVWPISVQCRVLQVSVAGYHEHVVRRAGNAPRRHLSDDALLVHIKAIHAETRASYGWPRTWKALLARGIRVGKERVQTLMQQHAIRARGKRRFKVTTDSRHGLPAAPNRLNCAFTVAAPDRVWVGDITAIATDPGWLFLAVVIDLFSRQVVGWSLRPDMARAIVIDALRMAWFKRHPARDAGLIFHSDRGSPVCQPGFPHPAGRVRHHRLDEPARQLLGQRLQRDLVRLAEGGAAARPALHEPAPGQGCRHGLAALVQPDPITLDAGVRQPDAVRRKLARQPTPASQCVAQLWDTDSRGKVRGLGLVGIG